MDKSILVQNPSIAMLPVFQASTLAVARSAMGVSGVPRSVTDDAYGADNTGVADATSAILAAIGTGNCSVYFPPGTYRIGTGGASDGINILYSDVELIFAAGATLVKDGTGGCITLARAASTTINRIRICGARIASADTSSANGGIVIAPDATNAAHYVTIENCIITSMGQYGIVQSSASGGANFLTISNTVILTNGALTGAISRQALILNPSVGSASHDLTISNVYAEQINDTGGSPESDGCKIQNFTGVSVSNFTIKCSGSAVVMSAMVFNNNTNLVGANWRVICGGSTGLQIDSSSTGFHEITNVIVTGTISGNNAVYLATNGSNKMSLRGIETAGAITGIGTHERLEISDSVIDLGIDLSLATVNNSVIRGNTCRAAIYLAGANNLIRQNISLSSSTYAVRVAGNANVIDGNYALSPSSGHVQIVSGTSNLVGELVGNTTLVDSGTTTVRDTRLIGPAIIQGTTQQLKLYSATDGGSRGTVYAFPAGTKYNWYAGAQNNVDNGFEITPSTATGGTTFSAPAFKITQTGDVTLTGGVRVTGGSAATGNIWKDATTGLSLQSVAGSSYDWWVGDPSGNTCFTMATGTKNLRVVGTIKTDDTTDCTAIGTASQIMSGGASVAKNLLHAKGRGAGVTSTATAAGTTTLTSSSTEIQTFTGSTTQTVQFPAANLFGAGIAVVYTINNQSSGTVTPTRAGSDTFQGGGATDPVLAGATTRYVSDGVSVWLKV